MVARRQGVFYRDLDAEKIRAVDVETGDEFATVLRAQPSNDEALAFTCYVQRKQGKIEKALVNIKRASEINPVRQQWAMDVPEILIFLKRFSEAAEACDRAITLFPGWDHPHRVKAWVCLYRDGATGEARKVLQEASKHIESAETEYPDILAVLDVFDGNYEEALERLPSTGDVGGPFLPRVLRIAQIHGYMDNTELAKKYYEEARRNYEPQIAKGLDGGTLRSRLAIAYAGLGDKKKAIREAEKAMEMFPVTLDAFFHPQITALAHMYMMLEDHEKAIDQSRVPADQRRPVVSSFRQE